MAQRARKQAGAGALSWRLELEPGECELVPRAGAGGWSWSLENASASCELDAL